MLARVPARAIAVSVGERRLTPSCASVCIAPVKGLLLIAAVVVCASCTTLENRRDLYRSPAEGYEQWYPQPPPTRLPSTGPATRAAVPVNAPPVQQHGVISFPEEPGLPAEEGR